MLNAKSSIIIKDTDVNIAELSSLLALAKQKSAHITLKINTPSNLDLVSVQQLLNSY